jgi:hypothetical protein
MANDNLSGSPEPVATTAAPTEDELVEQISDLLDDPATDPVKEPEDAEAAPVEEDDPLGLERKTLKRKKPTTRTARRC